MYLRQVQQSGQLGPMRQRKQMQGIELVSCLMRWVEYIKSGRAGVEVVHVRTLQKVKLRRIGGGGFCQKSKEVMIGLIIIMRQSKCDLIAEPFQLSPPHCKLSGYISNSSISSSAPNDSLLLFSRISYSKKDFLRSRSKSFSIFFIFLSLVSKISLYFFLICLRVFLGK